MKRFLTAAGLLLVVVAVSAAATAAALPDYSGTWVLDKEKTGELPPMMAGMEKIELTVKQDEKTITVKNSAAETEITYKLDSSKEKVQVGGRLPGEATVYVEKKSDGKLVFHSVRELNFQGNAVTITITDAWELTDNGKTLKTKRTIESPRGTQELELFFTKKS